MICAQLGCSADAVRGGYFCAFCWCKVPKSKKLKLLEAYQRGQWAAPSRELPVFREVLRECAGMVTA